MSTLACIPDNRDTLHANREMSRAMNSTRNVGNESGYKIPAKRRSLMVILGIEQLVPPNTGTNRSDPIEPSKPILRLK
jgi:hypothetical protein